VYFGRLNLMDPELRSHTLGRDVEDEYFSLRESLQLIRRRLWIVALVTIAFVGAVVALNLQQTPQYEASIKVLISQKQNAGGTYDLSGNVEGLKMLTLTLVEAVDSRPLAKTVIEELDLRVTPERFLQENLSVEQIPETQFIRVSYRDPDPERAQRVANTIGEVFSERISGVSPDAGGITAIVWEPAAIPEEPVSPDPVRNVLLALVLGLIVGLALAFLWEYFDDRWDSLEEAQQVSGVPTFGFIPEFKVSAGDKQGKRGRLPGSDKRSGRGKDGDVAEHLVTLQNSTSVAAEAYRTLRTNLLYGFGDNPPKTIVLTSPGPREGKSTTCANLGVVLAQAGKKTLIVDCDLRKPVMHKAFQLRNVWGLVDLLAGEYELQSVLQQAISNLFVLSTGPPIQNPAELLSSKSFVTFLSRVREEFEYVLIDSTPVQLVADPAIIASQSDGVLLILDAQNSRKRAVRQSMGALEVVRANVIGTVINKLRAEGRHHGYEAYTHM
jgi:capsular exopolysaccharide synthesis family protein